MALCEAPITAITSGEVSWGRWMGISLGFRTMSRSSLWMLRPEMETGRSVGYDPVQRMSRDVTISVSSREFGRLTRTVQLAFYTDMLVNNKVDIDDITWRP